MKTTLSCLAVILSLTLLPRPVSGQATKTLVLEGDRAPAEASVSTKAFHYLPFTMPPGVTRLDIGMEIDDKKASPDEPGNTLDHGLIAPGSLAFERADWRAWQGGARKNVTIANDPVLTTPWYQAGPLPAGTWNLVESYLKANAHGYHYRYTLTFHLDGTPTTKPLSIPRYAPGVIHQGPAWYAGNLHCHTIHSDGAGTLMEVVRLNQQAGFDFLALTDHNNPTGHAKFAEVGAQFPQFLLIPGMEWTSPSGHANAIGLRPGTWLDFRADPGDGHLPQIIDKVHQQGGFFVANHPFAGCTTCGWLYPEKEWERADAIEVWNGVWDATDEKAVALWDGLLKQGKFLRASGGTDYHRPPDALIPATRLYADNLSEAAILKAYRARRIILTRSPSTPCPEFTLNGKGVGATVTASSPLKLRVALAKQQGKRLFVRSTWGDITPPGGLAIDRNDFTYETRVTPGGAGYYRVEVREAGSNMETLGAMIALTNPIFVLHKAGR